MYKNTLYVGPENDVHLFLWTSCGGWADDVALTNNLFYTAGTGRSSYALKRTDVGDGKYVKMSGFGESPPPDFGASPSIGAHEPRE